MRKSTKAALAIGTGVALLLGGAGTLATWNGSAQLGSNAKVDSGNLTIAAATPAVWAWKDASPFNPVTDRLVPGDEVSFTKTFDVTATGNHLAASIDITGGALDAGYLTATKAVTLPSGVTGSGPYTFAASNSATPRTFTITVKYTLTFPLGAAGDNTTQNKSVNLTDAAVTVTQVAP